jgi:hypothetical protein
LLVERGLVDDDTTIATTAHPLQLLDEELPETAHDFRVDVIVTPDEVVRTRSSEASGRNPPGTPRRGEGRRDSGSPRAPRVKPRADESRARSRGRTVIGRRDITTSTRSGKTERAFRNRA